MGRIRQGLAMGVIKLLTLAGMADSIPKVARCTGDNARSRSPGLRTFEEHRQRRIHILG
jgi:hypothetical protein